MPRNALGRGFSQPIGQGLSALFATPVEQILEIDIANIRPNPYQPRKTFDPTRLAALAESLQQHGLLQPILVQPAEGETGRFELVAGERRWRAAQQAGFTKIPAIVKTARGERKIAWALLENIQREDLNPIERARAYAQLISEFHLTQEEIATKMGIDRSSVANILRLLQLSQSLQEDIAAGRLTLGHAKVLLSLDSESAQTAMAHKIQVGHWSVRQAECEARRIQKTKVSSPTSAHMQMTHTTSAITEVETRLRHRLGTRVQLVAQGQGGEIRIRYHSLDELDRLLIHLMPRPS